MCFLWRLASETAEKTVFFFIIIIIIRNTRRRKIDEYGFFFLFFFLQLREIEYIQTTHSSPTEI